MVTRRVFLERALGGAAVVSVSTAMPRLFAAAGAAEVGARGTAALRVEEGEAGRVLVVLQLSGGNDGLNTVVPYEDDAYGRSRPTLRLPRAGLHRIAEGLGFHPRMEGFKRLFDAGQMAVVQGVGYPDHEGDHDRAMRVWHTGHADPEAFDTGWAGRVADRLSGRMRPGLAAVMVGRIPVPLGLRSAETVVTTVREAQDLFPFAGGSWGVGAGGQTERGVGDEGGPSGGEFLRQVQGAAEAVARQRARLEAVLKASSGSGGDGYPGCPLGEDLRTVALLIQARLGIRLFFVEMGGGGIGGFDNHANQMGNHCSLLQQMSESVAAFVADVGRAGRLGEVLLMTFSEFGRTVGENGRRGTDHGLAGPMFLVGGGVRAGLHGAHPSLGDLERGGLRHHTDFRAVYATVLERWLGVDPQTILGGEYPTLDLLRPV